MSQKHTDEELKELLVIPVESDSIPVISRTPFR